jgi:mRNA interferase HicA
VYGSSLKRRELEVRLRALGWVLERHGGRHDVWTDGERLEYVPRHADVSEQLARKIIQKASSPRGIDS